MKKIWKYSKGVPRKINILCDNALLIGYGLGKKRISKAIVKEAIKDLSWSPYRHYKKVAQRKKEIKQARPQRFFPRVVYASIVLLLGFFLGAGTFHQWQYFPGVMAELPNRVRHIVTRFPGAPAPHSAPAIIKEKSPEAPRNPKETASINYSPLSVESSERPEATNEPDPMVVSENKDQREQREMKNIANEPGRMAKIESPDNKELPYSISARRLIPKSSIPTTVSKPKSVVVEYGDTLSWIVQETYGEYQNMLPEVLQANPQLQNPDLIIPGQIIMLPRKIEKDGLPINPAS